MPRPDPARLIDILESAQKIRGLLASTPTFEDFVNNEPIHDAVLYRLMIIGEATSTISAVLKLKYPFIEWKMIVGFRNRIIHEYFATELGIIWYSATESVPKYVTQIKQIFRNEFPELVEFLPTED